MKTEWIKERLREIGKTQADLAVAISRTSGAVSQLLSGNRSIKLEEVEILAAFLRMNASDFLRQCGLELSGSTQKVDREILTIAMEATNQQIVDMGVIVPPAELAKVIAHVYSAIAADDKCAPDVANRTAHNLVLFTGSK